MTLRVAVQQQQGRTAAAVYEVDRHTVGCHLCFCELFEHHPLHVHHSESAGKTPLLLRISATGSFSTSIAMSIYAWVSVPLYLRSLYLIQNVRLPVVVEVVGIRHPDLLHHALRRYV